MTSTERIEAFDHYPLIERIARQVANRYGGYVQTDDLTQEAMVWWYGRGQRYLPAYLADEDPARLTVSLRRCMESYARSEKAGLSGYEPRDQYRYSAREVIALIPVAMEPEGLPEAGHGDGPSAKGNLAEGGDLLAALVDVRRALTALTESDLHFLTLADDCSYIWERVAARMAGGVPDSLRRRHARIAERMARWLSNEEDEPK